MKRLFLLILLVGGCYFESSNDQRDASIEDQGIERKDTYIEVAAESVENAVCGNTKKEAGEECDDGNTENGDGCDSTCKQENTGACNPLYQYGCKEDEKCGLSLSSDSPSVICVPREGDVAEDQPCRYKRINGGPRWRDNCKLGLACILNICRSFCDLRLNDNQSRNPGCEENELCSTIEGIKTWGVCQK